MAASAKPDISDVQRSIYLEIGLKIGTSGTPTSRSLSQLPESHPLPLPSSPLPLSKLEVKCALFSVKNVSMRNASHSMTARDTSNSARISTAA